MTTLIYKGKELDSKWLDGGNVEREIIEEIRNNYYKTTKNEAIKQLQKILLDGGVKQDKVFKYYFEKIANDTLVKFSKWTINELLQSDELVSLFVKKSMSNDKVFTSSDVTDNFRTSIRLSGKGYARAVTQFPLKENIRLINENNIHGGIVGDMACGWGTRMIAAATTGNNYIGFEVNEPLIDKLNELGNDIQTIIPDFKFKIFEHGSEIKENSLVNKIDFILTSPPYFDLEAYTQNGDEVYSQSYEDFKNDFLYPMTVNGFSYLKDNGSFLINIKDSKEAPSMTDIVNYVDKYGLKTEKNYLKNIKRTSSKGGFTDSDEDVLVIKK